MQLVRAPVSRCAVNAPPGALRRAEELLACADLSQCDRGHFEETVEPPFGRGRQIRTVTNAGASIPLMSAETLIVLGLIVLVAVVITAVAAWIIW
jgi:hypothetical protein